MIEIWFRFRFLILFIAVIVLTYFSFVIFKGEDGSIQIPLIVGSLLWWGYLLIFYGLDSDEHKEYHLTQVNRNFLTGKYLTVISYHLMNADGKISDTEKNYFKNFMYEEFEVESTIRYYIRNLYLFPIKKNSLKNSCERITQNINNSGKVQLLHYYISLITVDKFLSVGEIALLRKICKYSQIHYRTLEAVLAMFNYTSEEDLNRKTFAKTYSTNSIKKHYTILEIEETATESEIKSAYRRLVKIYHPDKQKIVTEHTKQKFQVIQEAYEKVKTHKGFN